MTTNNSRHSLRVRVSIQKMHSVFGGGTLPIFVDKDQTLIGFDTVKNGKIQIRIESLKGIDANQSEQFEHWKDKTFSENEILSFI